MTCSEASMGRILCCAMLPSILHSQVECTVHILHIMQGYGLDAVASATNTLESSSRKGVQEAVLKAGHSLPVTSMTATAGSTRAAAGAKQTT